MIRQKISILQGVATYFKKIEEGWQCKLCDFIAFSLTGISVHWRKTHQHDTRIIFGKRVPVN